MKRKSLFSLCTVLILGGIVCIYLAMNDASEKNAFDPITKKKEIEQKKDLYPSYHINAKVNFQNLTLSASQTVSFYNRYPNNLHEIVFHLYPDFYNPPKNLKSKSNKYGDIFIQNVEVSGQKVSFTQSNQILKVFLEKALEPKDQLQIKVDFQVKIPVGNERLNANEHNYSLTKWYPILSMYNSASGKWDERKYHAIGESDYSDFSNYEVSIQVPKEMTVVATGMETEKLQKSIKQVQIKAPMVREFAFFISPSFEVLSQKIKGVNLNLYVEKGDEKKKQLAHKLFQVVGKSFSFFTDRYGAYQYPEFDIVETGIEGLNMEYPTIVQMGKVVPDLEGHLVHELAHQWFYGMVASDSFHNPALDESLAQYATKYYFEKNSKKDGFLEYFSAGQNPIFHDSKAINRPVNQFSNMQNYQLTVYKKGTLAMYDLQLKIGEAKMDLLLNHYIRENRYKNATFEQFVRAVNETAGKEMGQYIHKAFLQPDYYPKHLLSLRKK